METIEYLRALQLLAFIVLALGAGVLWIRLRSRPSGYLASAFATLAVGVLVSRLAPSLGGLWDDLATAFVLTSLLAFPWLLAAMAWSFAGGLPAWLQLSAFPAATLAAVPVLFLDVLPGDDEAVSVLQGMFLVAYVGVWTLFAIAAAVRLWRSGGRARVVRARMRLMAVGLLVLNLALLLAGADVASERPVVAVTASLLTLVSAAAFLIGFAPPAVVRAWWRRRSGDRFQEMQAVLIGAMTPTEVAQAVAPILADLVGGGVAVIGRDGTIQATAHVDAEQLAVDRARLLSGDPLDGDVQIIEVDAYWLVVRTTSYTPVFGQGERELVDGLAIQLRLALERAELFQAHLEARAAAEAASQELEATLMGLSHDLKSPTAAISGFAELLERSVRPDERAHIVEQIQMSTRYLEDLVDALLEYSKVGRTQVEVEPVDLATTVARVARRLAVTDPEVTVVVHGQLPVVLANPVRAQQLFDNLIGNAAKHGGREDLTVTIQAEHGPDGVRMLVSDNGRGLGDSDAERIFALFARGDRATRAGSGVGLGMVRRIAESYGGTVRVVPSEDGATFEILLPDRAVVDTGGDVRRDRNGPVLGRGATK